jgi:hypothetical protein
MSLAWSVKRPDVRYGVYIALPLSVSWGPADFGKATYFSVDVLIWRFEAVWWRE